MNTIVGTNRAYLELIIGCMKSGKTSSLIEIYKKNSFCNIPVLVINHSLDNRYNNNQTVVSHDGLRIPCIVIKELETIFTDKKKFLQYMSSSVILINEGQFFPDLVVNVKRMLVDKKKVYICGLDGDFEREKIGNILDLIPLCDKVSKLTAICEKCKNYDAIFSKRITSEVCQIVIGNDNYMSMCRECYEE